jgi:MoxR-like ATPase
MQRLINDIKQEVSKVIIAQDEMIEGLLIALICQGHILVEGVPGLAKTSTIKALSTAIDLDFKRVQFTPDLLPSDIIGAQIYDPSTNSFQIKKGPIFTNLLLADEINRSPSKVQSALLEAMQEQQVTIGDNSFSVGSPFMVMATQNPLEQEGVYKLPEAQLDRFMFKILIYHNKYDDELEIMRRMANQTTKEIKTIAISIIDELESIKLKLQNIHIDLEIEKYILAIIRATREENINITYGASPRASIDLYKASKAKALMQGKKFVSPADVVSMAYPVLRHRIGLSYQAQAQKIKADDILKEIIKSIPIP